MSQFGGRLEIVSDRGVVAARHHTGARAAMDVLSRGGNAFDAAAAAAFTLQVTEPNQHSLGGEAVILFQPRGAATPTVVCGQGTTPNAACIEHFLGEGLEEVPETGTLSAVVPGAFGAWMLLLEDHGKMYAEDLLSFPVGYAERGFSASPELVREVRRNAQLFSEEWRSSAAVYLNRGSVPTTDDVIINVTLAGTYRTLLAQAKSRSSNRCGQLRALKEAFYSGFVAEHVDRFVRSTPIMDNTGIRRLGVLSGDDLLNWEARYEPPLQIDYRNYTIFKPGAWRQGAVLLQTLRLLESINHVRFDPENVECIHLVTEASKLTYSDREAWYGDPDFFDVPIDRLLAREYASSRREYIGERAMSGLVPGRPDGREPRLPVYQVGAPKSGGDTCHIAVVDELRDSHI